MRIVRIIVGLFALIGLVVVVLAAAGGWLAWHRFSAPSVPDTIVLRLNLNRPLADAPGRDGLLAHDAASVRDAVDSLDRARLDPRVKGVLVELGGDQFSLAAAQEIGAAIARLRADGRFALAYADSFGEFGPGNVSYAVAAACNKIWMQPTGMVGLTGVAAQVPFARDTLNAIGVDPEISARKAYKTAPQSLTDSAMSDAHRQMLTALTGDLEDQLVGMIAAGRHLKPDAVRTAIDHGPQLARESVALGLVDSLGYRDEARDAALGRAGAGAHVVDASTYLRAAGRPHDRGPTVAVIYAAGLIHTGSSGNGLLGSGGMGADTIAAAFHDAAHDSRVKAIVFRIDSGGGSVVASDTIRRALDRAEHAGKPVIVSMAGTAASGGYWIAMDADKIVAEPATLTGSIGVFGGKLATEQLWNKLGIHWGTVATGADSTMFSNITPYDTAGQARLDAMLDDIYARFTHDVSVARHLTPAAVEAAAQGRVWTGRQALSLGLVDQVGDLEAALDDARKAIGLTVGAPITVTTLPRPESKLAEILSLARGRGLPASFAALGRVASEIEPLVAGRSGDVLMMPPTGLAHGSY